MYENLGFWLIIVLFIYKLLLKPLIKFSESISITNSDDPKTNGLVGIEEIEDNVERLSGVSLTRKYPTSSSWSKRNGTCTSDGIYLGPRDVPADCATLCGSSDFSYKFVTSEDSVIVNYKFLSKSGGYCLPENVLHCNTYTSRLVKTIDDWKCLPKGRLFGGEDGCQIIGCNGFIKDNLTGVYYNGRIPLTLAISDPDTETVSHEHVYGVPGPQIYRFQCTDTETDPVSRAPTQNALKCSVKDFMNNKLIESEYSRFDRIRNLCASLIYNASHIITPNFREGTCSCLAKFHANHRYTDDNSTIDVRRFVDDMEVIDINGRCSPCINGWSEKENYTNVGIPCRKSFDNSAIDLRKVLLPCGVNGFDNKTAACLNVKIYISRGLSSFARKVFE